MIAFFAPATEDIRKRTRRDLHVQHISGDELPRGDHGDIEDPSKLHGQWQQDLATCKDEECIWMSGIADVKASSADFARFEQ